MPGKAARVKKKLNLVQNRDRLALDAARHRGAGGPDGALTAYFMGGTLTLGVLLGAVVADARADHQFAGAA